MDTPEWDTSEAAAILAAHLMFTLSSGPVPKTSQNPNQ
jgi:hypothetical protein